MSYICELRRLTNQFYTDYNEITYPEILRKSSRSYNVAIFEGLGDYFICVPFRTDMRHSSGFKFSNSKRSSKHQSGIDYKKMIIVSKDRYNDYIDSVNLPVIDDDEYVIYMRNLERINREAVEYLKKYIDYQTGVISMSERDYKRKYQFTSLTYFHKELHI